jgi:hypothetical protein
VGIYLIFFLIDMIMPPSLVSEPLLPLLLGV